MNSKYDNRAKVMLSLRKTTEKRLDSLWYFSRTLN